MPAGSNGARSTPWLGLAFLISAMTAGSPAAIFARSAPTKSRGFSAASAWRRTAASPRIRLAFAISSALTARIWSRMSATRKLLRQLHEPVELGPRRAALEHLEGALDSLLEASRLAGDVDRRAGVERDDIARGSRLVIQRGHDDAARLLHRGHAQCGRVVQGHAEFLRMDRVFLDLARLELADHGLAAHRDLVEALQAIDGHGVARTQ